MGVNKTISMSIRVSEEELEKIKLVARLSNYSSYSEFVRRTALMECYKIIAENQELSSKDQHTGEGNQH